MSNWDIPKGPDQIDEARASLKRYLLDSLTDLGYTGPTEFNPFFLLPEKSSDVTYAARIDDEGVKRKLLTSALKFVTNAVGGSEKEMYDFLRPHWQIQGQKADQGAKPPPPMKPGGAPQPTNNKYRDFRSAQANDKDDDD